MTTEIERNSYDAESDIAAWVVGSGMVLIQASAVVIGLLPCLLLLLPLILPFVVLGVVGGVLVGLPVGLVRLVRRIARPRATGAAVGDVSVAWHDRHRFPTIIPGNPSRQAHAGPAGLRRLPRLRRRLDRQRRAPLDPSRPALLGAGPAVDSERIPAHIRRLHAARWPRRRPAWPPPGTRRGNCRDRHLVADRRAGRQLRRPRRRPPGTGPRRRNDATGRALDPHDHVQGGRRPPPRARHLGSRGRHRVGGGRVARRAAPPRPTLAVGGVPQ